MASTRGRKGGGGTQARNEYWFRSEDRCLLFVFKAAWRAYQFYFSGQSSALAQSEWPVEGLEWLVATLEGCNVTFSIAWSTLFHLDARDMVQWPI